SSSHDHIDLECNQFSRESGESLELPIGVSVFDHEVAALDVTEVTQSLTKRLVQVPIHGAVERQESDSRDFSRLLCMGGERRRDRTSQRGQQEAAAVHHSIP